MSEMFVLKLNLWFLYIRLFLFSSVSRSASAPQVNIIPVIAKADTISKSELHKFKIKIMSELVSNGVQIYQFPIDDETVAKINTAMNVSTAIKQQEKEFTTQFAC